MPGTTLRAPAPSAADRVPLLLALLGLLAVASSSIVLGPEALSSTLIAGFGVVIVAVRPQWGVAALLLLLMVQYGSRRYEREGVAAGLASLVPVGSGLVTVNNVLGIFLALMVVYYVYRDGDWSFLKSRQVQLMAAITGVLVLSGFVSGIDPAEQIDLGLRLTGGQDPMRLLISRALFLVLFVFFITRPTDLRMIVGLFVLLAVGTAWSGSAAAIQGGGRAEVADYRAGGLEVLIQSTQNPNRLALICTLALVFIWEFGQAARLRKWGAWLATGVSLLLVVTVFLSASRGGVIGLGFATLMLFARRRAGSTRVLYGLALVVVGWMLIQQIVPEQAIERITNIPGLSESSEGGGSIERRGYTYGIALDIWEDAPLIGIGPGNWPFMRFLTDPLRSAAAPHNSYLKALVEGGVLTLGLYLALFWITVRDIWRCEHSPGALSRARADGIDWLVPATRISLVTFMVFSLFADLWDLIFSYLLIGLAAVLIKRYRPQMATA